MNKNVVDIIIPVYDGYEETRNCLDSFFECEIKNKSAFELIVINDASPNSKITAWLRSLQKEKKITLHENEKNLGFVKTVNKGMALHHDRDVILLNSDTLVANDWIDRMIIAANQDQKISTVTPFSNNAEIMSFPNFCMPNDLPTNTSVVELDQLFKDLAFNELIDVPTGVGFLYVD